MTDFQQAVKHTSALKAILRKAGARSLEEFRTVTALHEEMVKQAREEAGLPVPEMTEEEQVQDAEVRG